MFNQDQAINLLTKLIVAASAGLAAKYGFTADLPHIAGDVAALVMGAVAWWVSHRRQASDTRDASDPSSPGQGTRPTSVLLWLLLPALLLGSGCQTQLDPAGVYETKFGSLGPWMYAQDNVVDSAVKTVDTAESWELQNHAYLVTNAPQVVLTLASIRVQAKQAIETYYQEREDLASLMQSTNAPAMILAVSNSIVTTVAAINGYAGNASSAQQITKNF